MACVAGLGLHWRSQASIPKAAGASGSVLVAKKKLALRGDASVASEAKLTQLAAVAGTGLLGRQSQRGWQMAGVGQRRQQRWRRRWPLLLELGS